MPILGILTSFAVLATGAPQDSSSLDFMVQLALRENPRIAAAQERVHAAEARISSSGTLPDPVLTLGLQSFPVRDPGFGDFMTMKMIGVSMSLPYPGKLTLREEAARGERSAAGAAFEYLRLDLVREVRQSWYDLALVDRRAEVVKRHIDVLSTLVASADMRYAVGTAGQEDVLRAQVEVVSLADEQLRLGSRRSALSAILNQLLNRAPDQVVGPTRIPDRVRVAAVSARPGIGFVSAIPDTRASTSPLRPLADLLRAAVAKNPTVHEHLARIEAQSARRDLAGKSHLPDFGVALSYGQRDDRTDMMSLSVAIPIPLSRGARQGAWVAEEDAGLAELRAEHAAHVNRLRSRVAELYSVLERDRGTLSLLTTGMVPLGSAALQAATAGFGVGRTDFQTVVANQATLFQFEIAFHQAVTDFAKNLAEIERLVGEEVLR